MNISLIELGKLRAPIALVVLLSVLPSRQTPAADFSQIFYLPLPEDQVQETLKTLHPNTGSVITSVTSAVVVGDDTIVTYDHWEDGYEADLANPTQGSSLIWGDGDPANGDASADGLCTPTVACQGDVLRAGATFTLKNNVQLPRDPSTLLWDGRDRMGADKITAVTRAAWAVEPGPVLAGALEVYPTHQFGTNFEVPLGENIPLPEKAQMFEYVDLMIMAGDEATVVTIDTDGPNGVNPPYDVSLGPGKGHHFNGGIQMGATVSATHPIQSHIITGNIGARYESRWFTLHPTVQWGSSIFTPVGTSGGDALTYIFLYNPSSNGTIEVDYETLQGDRGTMDIAPSTTSHFKMPRDSGAQFSSRNGERFFAIAAVGVNLGNSDNRARDWGFSLIPERNLTTQSVVAWGPGSDPSQPLQYGNPLWLTAIRDTIVYIDWGGDEEGQYTAPNGDKYDQAVEVGRLQSVSAMAPKLDNTAARLFTTNGMVFTAAWGQDPALPKSRNPFLDMGTTVLPIEVCDFSLKKGETLPRSARALCCLGMGRDREVQTQTGEEIVANVIRVKGQTMVSRGANYINALEGMGLHEDERIMTLEESSALLLFKNGCSYQLQENEMLTIGSESPCCLAAFFTPSQVPAKAIGIAAGSAAIIGILGIDNNDGGRGRGFQPPPISN